MRGHGHSGTFSEESQRLMEARCSFLAAVCVPEELLFGTGAGAHRSPLCPPPASRPGLVDKKKKKKVQLGHQQQFLSELLYSVSGPSYVVLFLAGGAGF